MLRRIALLLAAAPAAVLLVALAVTNRHSVLLSLDPFNAEPVLAISLPFYAYLLLSLTLGVLLGGFATWLGQGHWRRAARERNREARRWRFEADRLTRERDAEVSSRSRQLGPVGRRDAA